MPPNAARCPKCGGPNDWLHPAILRLINLAPRIRLKQRFYFKAVGSRIEGHTTPAFFKQKTFSADLARSPACWRSNDDNFWEPVKAILFHGLGDAHGVAQYLSAELGPDSPPSQTKKDGSIALLLQAPAWQKVLVLLLYVGAGFAAYQMYLAWSHTADGSQASKAPGPRGSIAPAPRLAEAPEPQAAETLPPPATEAPESGDASREPAIAHKRPQPAQTCYKHGDTVTVRGSASKATMDRAGTGKDVWILTTASPLCTYQAGDAAPQEMISQLQIVGTPPPAGVPLELTGELVTREDERFALNHRIRVKHGRKLD